LEGDASRPPGSSNLSENLAAPENDEAAALDGDEEAAPDAEDVPVVFCDVDCCACCDDAGATMLS
jgi:hypothetical protein